MPRTTPGEVREALGVNYNGTSSLDIPIRSANVVTTRVLAGASAKGITLTTEEALLIETYVAAHFYLAEDPLYTQRSSLKASGSFNRDPKGDYLVRAKALDYSGTLADILEGQTLQAFWLGKTESEQLTYEERN